MLLYSFSLMINGEVEWIPPPSMFLHAEITLVLLDTFQVYDKKTKIEFLLSGLVENLGHKSYVDAF